MRGSRSAAADSAHARQLLQLADQCVKCGFCLPHCPTFRLFRDEAESPRGRIALIQGLMSGALDDGPRLGEHLGNCLECRACEPACPSLVQFGTLMDGARAERFARLPRHRRMLARMRLDILTHGLSLRPLAAAAALYRRSGVAWLARALGLLREPRRAILDGLAWRLRMPGRRLTARADAGAHTASAGLFLGCIARGLEPGVAQAAQRVMQRLEIALDVPDGQVCCGAMHRHNGQPGRADALLNRNAEAFRHHAVVGTSSACVAELRLRLPAVEVCRFLVDTPWPAHVRVAPLAARAAVHEPCSHRNVLRDTEAVYALLRRIPALDVVALDGNETCCGAAGTYLLEHPDTAVTLAADKVAHLARLEPNYLVTTNSGCAAHLAARLREAGLAVEVLHPVELLERQLYSAE
ncbi:MAG: (Fe-S)-binding protein [Thiohalocapsa sp.]|nr:(Fe-S)-binding protein [Thiohalocapsa sp.]MCF7990632.1 (Fe-S)-binding protein [Thiohalocapsa sp.]